MTILASNSDGREHGAGTNDALNTNFFIAGVKDEMSDWRNGALSPRGKHIVEFCGGPADLRGCDFQATKLFQDFGDAPGGCSLKIHLRDGDD